MDVPRWPEELPLAGFLAALGIGLLVGLVRERARVPREADAGGVRTHTVVALTGATAMAVGPVGIGVAGLFLALSTRRRRASAQSPVAEVAILVTFLLGALAVRWPTLAAALGVIVSLVLANKSRLHTFSRQTLSAAELHDLLLLAAAAFVVLPLLPDVTLDPWGAINPRRLWFLVVAVMSVSSLGYVALRSAHAGVGLLLAGLAGGVISSTATVATMGERIRRGEGSAVAAACVAMFSSVASAAELAVVVGVVSPMLLAQVAWPLAASAAGGALIAGAYGVVQGRERVDAARLAGRRPFDLWAAIRLVGMIAGVMAIAAFVQGQLGRASLPWTAALTGLADVHAAAAAVAQLVAAGTAEPVPASRAILAAFAASSAFKTVLAVSRGSWAYGFRVGLGLAVMACAYLGVIVARGGSGV